jgi:hypothetical protein
MAICETLEATSTNGLQVGLGDRRQDDLLGIATSGDVHKAPAPGASVGAPIGEHMNVMPITGRARLGRAEAR